MLMVHDFDEPLFTRKTCLRRAFWLITYSLLGWSCWIRALMPRWLMYEKYSQAKALAMMDKMLGVDAVFALTDKVKDAFPTLQEDLEEIGFEVVYHWHLDERRRGINEWTSRGAWDRVVDPKRLYMNYDRHYVLEGDEVKPEADSQVIWHVDHLSYNLYFYLEFLMKFGGLDL